MHAIIGNLWHWFALTIPICGGAFGVFLVICAIVAFVQRFMLLSRGRRTWGKVVGYENLPVQFDDGSEPPFIPARTTFRVPIVTFEDESGRCREMRIPGSRTEQNRTGDAIPVIYSPRNPEICFADRFGSKWGPVIVVFLLGTILTLVSVFFVWVWMT